MKTVTSSPRVRFSLLRNLVGFSSALFLTLSAAQVRAGVDYWDPQGTTGANPYTGSLNGLWESNLWSTSSSGSAAPVAWTEGNAVCFAVHTGAGTPAFTVTMNTNHTVAGFFNGPLTPDPSTVTINGTGSIVLPANTFQGCDVTTDGASDPGSITFNVPILGTNNNYGTGLCAEGSGQVYLNGINAYSGGTYLGYSGASFTGLWNFTNADPGQPGICTSFGTAGIYLSNCYGALVVEGSAAMTITNPVSLVMPATFSTYATLNIVGNPAGVTFSGPWALSGATNSGATVLSGLEIGSGGATSNLVTISGVVSGTNTFNKYGVGILDLSATNTYTGNTVISNGTFGLTGNGSISNSPLILIQTNCIFDVSTLASGYFSLSSSTALTAFGVGSASGSSPSTINGPLGGTVDLGSQPINLTFSPTNPTGDITHPALNIAQGTLSLNGNAFTVNNSSVGLPLGAGTYLLIQQASGDIISNGTYSVTVTGTGIASGATASIQVSGGAVNLLVTGGLSVPLFSNLSASQSAVYGASAITLAGTVSAAGPVYPASGETVTVTIDGNTQTTTIDDSTGDFTFTYNPSTIPYSATAYPISYGYAGDGSLSGITNSTTTLTVTKAALTVTANTQSKTYGTLITTTGSTQFTSSALQNGETIGSVTLAVTATPTYSTNTPVGSYTITPSAATGGTFTAANYAITYVPATSGLTVTPKALTITANNVSKAYGSTTSTPVTAQTAFSSSGLANGQTNSSLTVTLTYLGITPNSPVAGSPYPNVIIPTAAVEASGKTNFNPANYTITYADGTLTITPLAVRLTGAHSYSGLPWVEANSLTVSNAVSGDNVDVVLGLGLLASANPGIVSILSPATLALGNAGDQGTGTGTGPTAEFNTPSGIALDTNGDLFVADTANNRIVEITPAGVETVVPFTGLVDPASVAVDTNNNIYVADPSLNEIVELPSGGTQTNLPITGLNYPAGVAVDQSGDVFVADTLNGRVEELSTAGVQSTLPFSGVTGLFLPSGVAVDTNGDVYVANAGSNNIVELSATEVQSVLPFTGLNFATGVAVDASSNIYAINYGGASVTELSNAGVVSTPAFTGLSNPVGLAADASGDLFVTDSAHNRIAEFSGGASTSFAGTPGVPNYTLTGAGGTVTNIGAPSFAGLTNATIAFGTPTVTLTGTLNGSGTNFTPNGTPITVTINGTPETTAVAGSAGAFSINYPTAGLQVSGSPYTVTYSVLASATNAAASDSTTTLTVTNALSASVLTASANPALPATPITFTDTVSALAPSVAVPDGSVQLQIDGSVFGTPVILTNGAAVITVPSLSHGYHTVEADYLGDTNIAGSTNVLTELVNTAPVAGTATFLRQANLQLTIAISDLLTNATDADGDALSLVAVSPTSTNGAAISTNATTLTYTPAGTNANVTDSFTYTVSDPYGATNTGTVVIMLLTNATPVSGSAMLLANGSVQLSFSGTPGYIYLIQDTTNLLSPIIWTTVDTNTAAGDGSFSYTDTSATNAIARYYRTITP